MPTPALFYFDLGNVLLHFDHAIACQQVGALVGIPAARVREILFDSGVELEYERGSLSDIEFHAAFCSAAGVQCDRHAFLYAFSAIFQLNSAVVPIVAHLRGSGQRLGILSNTCAGHWNYCWQRYRVLRELFDVHALSYELKSLKPAHATYQLAAQLAGVPADRVFFVDDRAENVSAANEAGFDAVLFTSAAALAVELRNRSVAFNY